MSSAPTPASRRQLEMIDLPGRESRLRKALAPIQKDYDFIFIDCRPALTC